MTIHAMVTLSIATTIRTLAKTSYTSTAHQHDEHKPQHTQQQHTNAITSATMPTHTPITTLTDVP